MIPVVVDGNSYDAEDCQALVAARAAGRVRRADLEAVLVAAGMGKTRSRLVLRILLERGVLAAEDGAVALTPVGLDVANQASPPQPAVVERKCRVYQFSVPSMLHVLKTGFDLSSIVISKGFPSDAQYVRGWVDESTMVVNLVVHSKEFTVVDDGECMPVGRMEFETRPA